MTQIVLGALIILATVVVLMKPIAVAVVPALSLLPSLGSGAVAAIATCGLFLVMVGIYRRLRKSETRNQYWLRTVAVTLIALAGLVFVTFAVPLLAATLNIVKIGGFPLGYYMGAQGCLILLASLTFFATRKLEGLDGAPPSDGPVGHVPQEST